MTGRIPERPNHPKFTDKLWELTQQCLKPKPSDRPRVEQVLEALRDMDGSRKVSLDPVGAQPPRTPKDDTNKTSSRESVHTHSPYISHSTSVRRHHPSARSNCWKLSIEATAKCWWDNPSCAFVAEFILIDGQEPNRLRVVLGKSATLAIN